VERLSRTAPTHRQKLMARPGMAAFSALRPAMEGEQPKRLELGEGGELLKHHVRHGCGSRRTHFTTLVKIGSDSSVGSRRGSGG
jgi:hypothetical protein